MWILRGDTAELATIREEDDFMRLTARAQMIVEDFTIEACHGGSVDDLTQVLGIFGETIQQFS